MTAATISAELYADLLGDWSKAIGQFILACSSGEYWVYLFAETYGNVRRDELSRMKRRERVRMARDSALALNPSTDIEKRVRRAFSSVLHFAHWRDLAAHNAPMGHVFVNARTGEVQISYELRSERDPAKQLTLAFLDSLFRQAVTLETELALLFGLVRNREAKAL